MKLSKEELVLTIGGSKNRSCMLLGGLAFGSLLVQHWGAAIGVTAGAIIYGCFS